MKFFTPEEKRILLLLTAFLFAGLVARQIRQSTGDATPAEDAARETARLALEAGGERFLATALAPQAPIDVNHAGSEELQTLNGIGPALARRIIDYRSENGTFRTIEELTLVSGIGPRLMKRWEGLLVALADSSGTEGDSNEQ